ncbi:hypothetical protein EVAR_10729_1 [Eumeta japonica]|uniref:Uncharacterized protein n=1 Tax=Eumeta variegata TaxID=151549 RepID=A0A4C1U7C5_EUMVA|nr:hypothetical protein EVAR_10729_1 [Eumeta japonica]
MENNPDRFSVIARSRKQVARPHTSRAWCDPPISARRSPSSRHLAPTNAQTYDHLLPATNGSSRRKPGHQSTSREAVLLYDIQLAVVTRYFSSPAVIDSTSNMP